MLAESAPEFLSISLDQASIVYTDANTRSEDVGKVHRVDYQVRFKDYPKALELSASFEFEIFDNRVVERQKNEDPAAKLMLASLGLGNLDLSEISPE